jgi:hypothetical protein
MSRIDPECFPPSRFGDATVCDHCFSDEDLVERIKSYEKSGECSYCQKVRKFVAPFNEIVEFIRERMETFYGLAVDQLPYESREGGYQSRHEDTYDCLYNSIGLDITSDRDDLLRDELVDEIGDEVWCDYDWLALEIDESLLFSWEQFCNVTKSHRRFFFHRIGETDQHHPDERSAFEFLHEVAELIQAHGFVRDLPKATIFFRARPNNGRVWERATELGPPPAGHSLQSNRMNPPGIPMFYGSSSPALATGETRSSDVTVGAFTAARALRVVDLAHLTPVPGVFSEATRKETQTLAFLHQLTEKMAEPVAQDNRVNVDYIPTQIVTEFLRDFSFIEGQIDGIQYVTALSEPGFNTVLFATQENVADANGEHLSNHQWLQLTDVQVITISESNN